MSEDVSYDVSDGIATLTLNRPERMNTISGPMLDELTRLLVQAGSDRDVRVIILTGTGRAFCAGLDLGAAQKGEGIGSSSATFGATIDLRNTPPTVLHALDKPVIAALNGSAAGYGMDLALGCDIRIMADTAKLGRIRDHLDGLLIDMAKNLYSGRIDAEPLCTGGRSPCTYCEFRCACTHRDGEHERTINIKDDPFAE